MSMQAPCDALCPKCGSIEKEITFLPDGKELRLYGAIPYRFRRARNCFRSLRHDKQPGERGTSCLAEMQGDWLEMRCDCCSYTWLVGPLDAEPEEYVEDGDDQD